MRCERVDNKQRFHQHTENRFLLLSQLTWSSRVVPIQWELPYARRNLSRRFNVTRKVHSPWSIWLLSFKSNQQRISEIHFSKCNLRNSRTRPWAASVQKSLPKCVVHLIAMPLRCNVILVAGTMIRFGDPRCSVPSSVGLSVDWRIF